MASDIYLQYLPCCLWQVHLIITCPDLSAAIARRDRPATPENEFETYAPQPVLRMLAQLEKGLPLEEAEVELCAKWPKVPGLKQGWALNARAPPDFWRAANRPTLVVQAAAYGRLRDLELLISKGADFNKSGTRARAGNPLFVSPVLPHQRWPQ